jgi:hypothetical protein
MNREIINKAVDAALDCADLPEAFTGRLTLTLDCYKGGISDLSIEVKQWPLKGGK